MAWTSPGGCARVLDQRMSMARWVPEENELMALAGTLGASRARAVCVDARTREARARVKGGTMPKDRCLRVAGVLLVSMACGCGKPAKDASRADAAALAGSFTLPPGPIGTTGAARLLTQGTFGATLDGIASASMETYADWFGSQVALTPTLQAPLVTPPNSSPLIAWFTTEVNAQDQLRQRVSFALSQILVVSEQSGALYGQFVPVAQYEDILTNGAFGNFRDILDAISHSPVMGVYLTYFKNQKPNAATGVHADENYAREIMQLFTVGLVTLNPDGTPQVDSSGNPIPTYGLPEVENTARVFTGWGSAPIAPNTTTNENAWDYDYDLTDPMQCYPTYHDTGSKTIIGGKVIPAGGTCQSDMEATLDALFNHPNVGPFIGQQLIQRLVTSNPSPAYVGRVAAAFNDDGSGVRGDLLAVVEAILTDPEARTAGAPNAASPAKLREPLIRFTNLYRAFAASDSGDANISAGLIVQEGYGQYDEAPYFSPSVFNFFRPNYSEPGPLANASLVAPEFQITNELTEVNLSNLLESQAYAYVDSAGDQFSGQDNYYQAVGAQDVVLKTTEWEPYASNAANLVDELGLVFMEGAMPDNMKATLISYLNTAPGPSSSSSGNTEGGNSNSTPTSATAAAAALKVMDAANLIINSPQYAIQR
jgi:uncharacterized protein (DUF1800 family)